MESNIESWQIMPKKCIGYRLYEKHYVRYYSGCSYNVAAEYDDGGWFIRGVADEDVDCFDRDDLYYIALNLRKSDLMLDEVYFLVYGKEEEKVHLNDVYNKVLEKWHLFKQGGYDCIFRDETSAMTFKRCFEKIKEMQLEKFKDVTFYYNDKTFDLNAIINEFVGTQCIASE